MLKRRFCCCFVPAVRPPCEPAIVSPFPLLRKPEWEHRDALRRAAAVASSQHVELVAKLPELARQDPDASVRLAAVRRLENLDLLRERMRDDADAGVRQAARQAFQRGLLDPSVTRAERQRLVAAEDDAEILAAIAEQAPESELRRLALQRVARPGLVLERCVRDPDPELRLWLLGQIDDIGALDRIAERVRKTDKVLNRRARERIQALRLAAGDPEALRERALAICEELDGLRRTAAENAAARRDQLEQEWQGLASNLDEAMQRRVTGYFEALDAALAGPPDPEPELPLAETGQADATSTEAAPAREPDVALAALVAELEARAQRLDPPALENLEKRWLARLRQVEPLLPEEHELEQRFRRKAETLQQRFRQQAQRREQARAGLAERIAALEAAIEAGQLAPARELQRQLDADRQVLAGQFPRALTRRLGRAAHELERLGQWQRWSGNKARLRLIETLEALAGSGLHPDALTAKIKELQGQWQHLDETEEGAFAGAAHPLAGRFHAAARRVMAPARAYFEKRSELRESHGEALEAFVAETNARLDANPGKRDLITLRRQVIDRLRQTDELDPGARRDAGRQLRGLLGRIKQLIAAGESEAEADKRKLLANLRRDLLHVELDAALPLAREAQARWKTLPRAGRRTEDALWAELRELVDPWFAQADARQHERQAAASAQVEEARTILDELDQLARADAATLAQADGRVAALRSRWSSLAETMTRMAPPVSAPPGRRRPTARAATRGGLDERAFDRALAKVQAAQARQREQDRQAAFERLLQAGAICDRIEALPVDAMDPTREELSQQLRALNLPASVQAALENRLAKTQAASSAGVERADELVVLAELAVDVDSPATARELRRRLQIERLSTHLSGGGVETDLDALLREYISLVNVPSAQRAALAPRWQAVLATEFSRA